MSRRAAFDNSMQLAVDELYKNYEAYEKEFREFFPELTANTQRVLKELTSL
jgi:acyl carrier protein phosphodiesterase